MPNKRINTSMGMSERQLYNWSNRVKKGGAFELEGAFGDKVFVPRAISDVDPGQSRLKNRLKLQEMRRLINYNKGKGSAKYIS